MAYTVPYFYVEIHDADGRTYRMDPVLGPECYFYKGPTVLSTPAKVCVYPHHHGFIAPPPSGYPSFSEITVDWGDGYKKTIKVGERACHDYRPKSTRYVTFKVNVAGRTLDWGFKLVPKPGVPPEAPVPGSPGKAWREVPNWSQYISIGVPEVIGDYLVTKKEIKVYAPGGIIAPGKPLSIYVELIGREKELPEYVWGRPGFYTTIARETFHIDSWDPAKSYTFKIRGKEVVVRPAKAPAGKHLLRFLIRERVIERYGECVGRRCTWYNPVIKVLVDGRQVLSVEIPCTVGMSYREIERTAVVPPFSTVEVEVTKGKKFLEATYPAAPPPTPPVLVQFKLFRDEELLFSGKLSGPGRHRIYPAVVPAPPPVTPAPPPAVPAPPPTPAPPPAAPPVAPPTAPPAAPPTVPTSYLLVAGAAAAALVFLGLYALWKP